MTIDSSALSRRRFLAGASVFGIALSIPGCAYARTPITEVESFRRVGMSDRDVVAAALVQWQRVGGTLDFAPGRTYNLGGVTSPNPIFMIRNHPGGMINGRGARLVCRTLGPGKTQMFLVQNSSNLEITNLTAEDHGVDISVDWKGMDFIHFEGGRGPNRNMVLRNITVDGAVSLVACSGDVGRARSRGLVIDGATAKNCYYGALFIDTFDQVSIDLSSIDCRRTYFPYGVTDHKASLNISHGSTTLGADACILVKRYGRDTGNLEIDARFEGVLKWSYLVKLEQQVPDGDTGTIHGIAITIDLSHGVSDPYNSVPLALTSYKGQREERATRNKWWDIELKGQFGPISRPLVLARTIPINGATVGVTRLTADARPLRREIETF